MDTIAVRLQKVTEELRQIQGLLNSEPRVEARVLTDFRDAVNRVRNSAWALAQFENSAVAETDPDDVLAMLAGERVRVAYQLCRLVQADLANSKIRFRKGQLHHLRDAVRELARQLDETVDQ